MHQVGQVERFILHEYLAIEVVAHRQLGVLHFSHHELTIAQMLERALSVRLPRTADGQSARQLLRIDMLGLDSVRRQVVHGDFESLVGGVAHKAG